jgi:hypothetical protein
VIAHWLLDALVIELYDVQVLPGVERPWPSASRGRIQRLITIDAPERPVFRR